MAKHKHKVIKFNESAIRDIEQFALNEMRDLDVNVMRELSHGRSQQTLCFLKAVTVYLKREGYIDFVADYDKKR